MRRLVAALVIACPLIVATPAHGHAIGLFDGGCAVSGSMSVSPSLTAIPQTNVVTNITVTGTCGSAQLLGSASFDVGGLVVNSCELGEGTLAGGVTSSDGIGTVSVFAAYDSGPGTINLVFEFIGPPALTFVGTAQLTWLSTANPVGSAEQDAKCPVFSSGSSIPVTGVLAFDE